MMMQRRYILIAMAAVFFSCAGHPPRKAAAPFVHTGRQMVMQTLQPGDAPANPISRSGFFSTALSSSTLNPMHPLKRLDPDDPEIASRAFEMELKDGTLVGGLLFEYADGKNTSKPLLMASFGFLQDRWGTEAAKFYEHYLKNPADRIPAHVLILDHPTSGAFLASNGCLSIGTYDDARMWMEVARKLKNEMCLTGIHLLGVSMSGQTVVHALLEDSRLGADLFESAIALSIAPDFHQAPGRQLAGLDTAEGKQNPWKQYSKKPLHKSLAQKIQALGVKFFIDHMFIPTYQQVRPSDKDFELSPGELPVFLWNACENRIARLRAHTPNRWNPEFSLTNLDTFMSDTRIAGVIHRINKPLVLLSALDDPAVAHAMYAEVVAAAGSNAWIAAYETPDGGHNGFGLAYGKAYLWRIMRLMTDPRVLGQWTTSPSAGR